MDGEEAGGGDTGNHVLKGPPQICSHYNGLFFNSNLTNSLKNNISDEFMCVWEDLLLYSLRNIDFLED